MQGITVFILKGKHMLDIFNKYTFQRLLIWILEKGL